MSSDRPLVGVGGVLVHQGKVVLVRRGKEPLRGRWSIPGGTVELGETLHEALVREMREETGLSVRPAEVLTVLDRIERREGTVLYHCVIVDYLCEYIGGRLRAGSDADEAALVAPDELEVYDLTPGALEVIQHGLARAAGWGA